VSARAGESLIEGAIPVIDVSGLFEARSPGRDRTDRAIMVAATTSGFMTATGFPPDIPVSRETRADLLRLFQLPAHETRKLWRQKFEPSHRNIYRGWFPLQPGQVTSKEGIDLGPDVAHGPGVIHGDDPLREQTPLPPEAVLPGWRDGVARYYLGMERVCQALMRSIARGLMLEGRFFDPAFDRGLSTLRLIRYPVRSDLELAARADPAVWLDHNGIRCYVTGAPHVDSGFLTLLAQDGVSGLQALDRDGSWIDVPPVEGTLAVNFGKVLERWSGGRIKATEHRVIGRGRERFSIPFFYEARADAEIRPLPVDDPAAFAPFLFGDYLWSTITKFVEFKGMEGVRQPKAIR
jgi:isopenicillin N synthase-like dioxygenase